VSVSCLRSLRKSKGSVGAWALDVAPRAQLYAVTPGFLIQRNNEDEEPELPRFRKRARSLGIGNHVEFTRLISSSKKLGMVLATADVCIRPNETNWLDDISTITIMEYMALGTTMVQFDLHEGQVSAGKASLYATRNDASSLAEGIIRFVYDSEIDTWMAQIDRQQLVTTLSWEMQVPKPLAAYQEAMEKDPQSVGCARAVSELPCD
jgi:glycosyltransferase involved in cell wall biosynthesis